MPIVQQKLHEIAEEFKEINEMVFNEELSIEDVEDHLEALDMTFAQKMEQCSIVRSDLKYSETVIDAEIKRLQARKKAIKNRHSLLSESMHRNMDRMNKTSLKTSKFTISIVQGSEYVEIVDEDELDDQFVEVKVEVSKEVYSKELKAALKEQQKAIEKAEKEGREYEGELIKGAKLSRKETTLRVK